jgi:hypothetical protein
MRREKTKVNSSLYLILLCIVSYVQCEVILLNKACSGTKSPM